MAYQVSPAYRLPDPCICLPWSCRFLIASTVLWLWNLAAVAERELEPPVDEAAAAFDELQSELAALLSELPPISRINRKLGEDQGLSRKDGGRLRQLDRRLVDFAVEHPEWASARGSGWFRAYLETSRLESYSNFGPDPVVAVVHHKEKMNKLESVRGHFSTDLQKQLLIDSTDRLLRQLHELDPPAVIDLVEFLEELLKEDLRRVPLFREIWLRDRGKHGRMVIMRDPAPGREDWQHTMLEWWREFLHDEEVSVRAKENEITSLAISLHTTGRSDEGLVWLRWLERQPEFDAWNSMSWLSHAFFASWIGVGDRELGQSYFERIQQLVDAGLVDPRNDLFRAVTSSYYFHLNKSDIQHQTDAAREAKSRFERSYPDAQR